MYKSYEFCIEVWPDTIRIHQGYETEYSQIIELDSSQIESFCIALKAAVPEAKALGKELEDREAQSRVFKSRLAGDK